MSRQLHDHKVNALNDKLVITVDDEPGAGGAHHRYTVYSGDSAQGTFEPCHVNFQNGPIGEAGINGLTHEALLAIIADRLRSFQKGPYSTKANACALTHIEEAMHWLHSRTLERMQRGVEGTMQK